MSSEWKLKTFEQLCDIKRGASPRPIQDWMAASGIPWVKISDATASASPFIDKTAEFIRTEGASKSVEVFPGDFILSNSATPGIPKFMKINACIHDGWLLLRNFRELDEWYCYYLLKTERENLIRKGNGSVFTNLKTEILKKHEVLIPPVFYQKKVAYFLRKLDDRINLLRETNATLEAIAQALFKSWFVDFDPVHANAHARAQNQNNHPQAAQPNPAPHTAEANAQNLGLDAATAALFPDHFQDSDLGPIPAGWSAKLLGEVYEINPTRKLKKGDVAPYLDMASVATQGHTVDGVINREMGSGSKFINGDTLLARITPCLENGKTAFVDFLDDEQVGWGSTEFVVMRPKSPLPPYHGYLLARFPAFRDFAIQSMSGTSGRQRVQNDVLAKYLIAVPTDEVANVFSEKVCCIQKTISANQQQAQTLTQLRDTLLPRLISGQLRLPDAEAQIEAVVGGA